MLKRPFLTKATQWQKEQPKVFQGVMLEFGAKKLLEIAPKDRQHFLTLMERRSPKKYMPDYTHEWRNDYEEGFDTRKPGSRYGIIQENYGMTRK